MPRRIAGRDGVMACLERGIVRADADAGVIVEFGAPRAIRPRRQVLAVETVRNQQRRGIAWQFPSRDARRKLERLYPVKEPSSD